MKMIEKLKAIKIRKILTNKYVISFGILSTVGGVVAHKVKPDNNVLDSNAQSKANDLSPLDRVRAINNSPQIKKDLISDEQTQKLMAMSGNPIQDYPANPIPKPENKNGNDLFKPDEKKTNIIETKVPVPSNIGKIGQQEPCSEYDHALKKCELPESYQNKVTAVSQIISSNTKESLSDSKVDGNSKPQIVEADLKGIPIPPDKVISYSNKEKNKEIDDSPLGLLVATASTAEVLNGRSTGIEGASNQIKAGTTVLAVLNEAKTITSAGETYASASIIGAPFDRKKFPEGVTLLLKMKLNGTQDGIEGTISTCSSRRNSDKSISCAGQLEDISGASALRGEVYSSTGWQIVTTAATTFLAGLSLSKMTTSASTLGTTVDQTAANALYQALSGAITSMGTQIATSFARSGTQISIPGRVVVRVLFTQDSVW